METYDYRTPSGHHCLLEAVPSFVHAQNIPRIERTSSDKEHICRMRNGQKTHVETYTEQSEILFSV